MNPIEPCPFCGNKTSVHAYTYKDAVYRQYAVKCNKCGARIMGASTELAIDKWNRRAERKKGEWIDGKPYVNSHWRVCSVCHETSPESCGGYNFCPNCGADMRGDR